MGYRSYAWIAQSAELSLDVAYGVGEFSPQEEKESDQIISWQGVSASHKMLRSRVVCQNYNNLLINNPNYGCFLHTDFLTIF